MNPSYQQTPSDTACGGRIVFQTVAIVSLAIVLGEKAWRLLRDLNRQNQYRGRG